MDIVELFDNGVEMAKAGFKATGMVFPTWVGVAEDGTLLPMATPTLEHKEATVAAIKSMFKERGVVAYVSILESWILGKGIGAEELEEFQKSGMAVSEHPDRKEVIFISAEDSDGNFRIGSIEILRPEGEEPKLAEVEIMPSSGTISGRFTNLLEHCRKNHTTH